MKDLVRRGMVVSDFVWLGEHRGKSRCGEMGSGRLRNDAARLGWSAYGKHRGTAGSDGVW